MAAFFRVIFSSKTDYDLKIVYFNKFLHVFYHNLNIIVLLEKYARFCEKTSMNNFYLF